MKLCRTNDVVSDWVPDYTDEGALQRRLAFGGSANSGSRVHTGLPKLTQPSLPLACFRAQVESGKAISAATSININNSKKTTLTKANNVYHFSPLPRQCSGYQRCSERVASALYFL
ncbi:uncharacterized protein HD556DRAFT_1309025 [Suillus plorans]|uniref:Uncharacterized protein n=1 Tax=Suillus plorans TaxID=116603 RepID=A0A9P7DHC5_9AGAM|nr:uncharacterized protein HD556DRAFT_1309025 [Suillus plorans]KAG1792727.1 hypothetical protein HD556DRAFT_1309025 [Suillus plorans]